MVFSNDVMLVHNVPDTQIETVNEDKREGDTYLLIRYEPTIKDIYDPANWEWLD